MNEPNLWSRITSRTTLITGTAIVGVVLAGGAAVAANIGILDAADDDRLGTLSATGDLVAGETTVIDVFVDETRTTRFETNGASRAFAVDRAGIVEVGERGDLLGVAAVTASPGWSWSVDVDDAPSVVVSLTDGVRTLVFTATRAADGSIAGDVAETTPPMAASAPIATSGPGDDHDDDDRDQYDEHEDDDDEHEDDDDEYEHEGRDDDD
jgi:hypothetical protein